MTLTPVPVASMYDYEASAKLLNEIRYNHLSPRAILMVVGISAHKHNLDGA